MREREREESEREESERERRAREREERESGERERESPAVGRVPRLHTGTSPQPHPTPQLVSLKRFFVTLTFFCVWVCKRIRELLAALALISYSDVRVVSKVR